MTKQVQRRRGTTAQHTGFTGAEGEISVNTTNKSIHVHDGTTAGGIESARADLDNVTTANVTSAIAGGTISSITLTTADINGGTIDGATIGASSAGAGTFTTLNATGGGALTGTWSNLGTVTTVDINGGSIDGVTIGGASAGAGTFTTVTASGEIAANGGIALGDNDVATFGDGDDLQIYHSGTSSRIQDIGTGNLIIDTNGTEIQLTSGSVAEYMLRAVKDGAVTLYYDNAAKLATTATGIDVTGTVTADGLTVDGATVVEKTAVNYSTGVFSAPHVALKASVQPDDNDGFVGATFATSDSNNYGWSAGAERTSGGNGDFVLTQHFNSVTGTQRMRLNSGGDISFYEDTGTTPKLFWDASAERLGLGTVTPAGQLHVETNGSTSDAQILIKGNNNNNIGSTNDFLKIRFEDTDPTSGAGGQPMGTIQWYGNDTSSYPAGVRSYIQGYGAAGSQAPFLFYSTGTHIFQTTDDGGATNTERMRIDSSGNVGIGTTSPRGKVEIVGPASETSTLANAVTNAGLLIKPYSSSDWGLAFGSLTGQVQSIQGVDLGGASSRSIAINALGGNVGIGTTSPAVKLDVVGQVRASTGILFGSDTAAANALDDYEEGTWTPTPEGSTGTAGAVAFTSSGSYTKVGNLVRLAGRIDMSNVGSWTGNLRITGVPFQSAVINEDHHGTFRTANYTFGASVEYYVARIPAGSFFADGIGVVNNGAVLITAYAGVSATTVIIVDIVYST